MRNIPEHRLRQSRVTAVFEDSALSFILAKGATLRTFRIVLAILVGDTTGCPSQSLSNSAPAGSHRKSTATRHASRT